MLIAWMLQAAVPDAAAFDHPWLRIVRSPALSGTSEELAVARTVAGSGAGRRSVDRVRLLRHDRRGGHRMETAFDADSRTCPAAARLVAEIEAMPMPHAVSPDTPTDIIVDGIGYVVTVEAGYGDMPRPMTFGSNIGTPLAAWVDARLAALEPCWMPA